MASLHRWLEEAGKTGIHSLERLVRTIRQDLEAVESAVVERRSNGPVEGQINRLKAVKRQMNRLPWNSYVPALSPCHSESSNDHAQQN